MIVKARSTSATSVENLVICSGTAHSRTGDQRVTHNPDSQLTKELMVCSDRGQAETPQQEDPHTFLLLDSEEEDKTVSLVRVHDGGSKSQTALVEITGVPPGVYKLA